MTSRKQEEAEFHDRLRNGVLDQRWSLEGELRLSRDPMWENLKYYSIERSSIAYMRAWLAERCSGKTVLDFGCGNGAESFFVMERGASRVFGIDISPAAISNCKLQAAEKRLADKAQFVTTDGEDLQFENDSFDLATEYGVLHHVELDRAMQQLARVLRPNGQMICTESLGHNPAIRTYRALTPYLRTKWEAEHILRRRDFKTISKYFGHIELKFFHLATLAAVPFRKVPWFSRVLSVLESIDGALLKVPFLQWYAWQVVFVLSEPRKEGAP